MPRFPWIAAFLALGACGRDEPAPSGPAAPTSEVVAPGTLPKRNPFPPEVPAPTAPAAEAPRPEAGLPPPSPLGEGEREVAGAWRLREFVAMSGQVPGGDARLVGTLVLGAADRRAVLRIESYRLQSPPGSQGTYLGGGRWRREGDEVLFEPFQTLLGTRVVDPTGPWALRWRIVREAGRLLLQAGEFTYEREDAGTAAAK